MADYREMYRLLFQAATRAIDILQKAQQETEELFIRSDPPDLSLMERGDEKESNPSHGGQLQTEIKNSDGSAAIPHKSTRNCRKAVEQPCGTEKGP